MQAVLEHAARAGVLLASIAAGAAGCDDEDSQAGPPPPLRDTAALRAKVSACTHQPMDAAFTFFWPTHLGGVREDQAAESCVAAASSCSEVLSCAGYAGAGCTDTQRCSGDTMVSCRRFGRYGITAERQISCADDPSGNFACSVDVNPRDPVDGPVAACHGSSCTIPHCDADVSVTCVAGYERRYDCALEDKQCIDSNGQPACRLPDECHEDHCSGDLLVRCSEGRVALRENCAELIPGSTCSGEGAAIACRAPIAAPGCGDPANDSSWCEGALGVFCVSGVRVEVDCGALPNGECQIVTDGDPSVATCLADPPFASGK